MASTIVHNTGFQPRFSSYCCLIGSLFFVITSWFAVAADKANSRVMNRSTLPPLSAAGRNADVESPTVSMYYGPSGESKTETLARIHLSGCPRITYSHSLPPLGVGGGKVDELQAKSKGPSMANWDPVWGESFFRFGFLDANWTAPGAKRPTRLFYPTSICRSVTAYESDTRAAAEMIIDTPVRGGAAPPRTALRVMRIKGDPWMYMRLSFTADSGQFNAAWLNALPSVYEWGAKRPHLDLQRCVWIAGHDLVLEKNGEGALVTDATDPKLDGGMFWYNRGSYRTGGNLTVYLPEQVQAVRAKWGWPVTVSFSPAAKAPRHMVFRLALFVWRDDEGWEAGLDRFKREIPEKVETLRNLSFAWPVGEQFETWERDMMDRLSSADAMFSQQQRNPLISALQSYDRALAAIADSKPVDTDRRFALERQLFVQRDRAREEAAELLEAAQERGWPLVDEVDAAMSELENLLND